MEYGHEQEDGDYERAWRQYANENGTGRRRFGKCDTWAREIRASLRGRRLFALFALINLVNYIDRGVIPGGSEEFNAFIITCLDTQRPDVFLGVLQSAFIVGFSLACLLFARLAKTRSPFTLMTCGLSVWCASAIMAGLSRWIGSYSFLTVARLLSGVGEASFVTVVPPLITETAPPGERGVWLALFYTAIPVGGGLGYVYGSLLATSTLGWQWAFYFEALIMAPLAAICGLVHHDEATAVPDTVFYGSSAPIKSAARLSGLCTVDEVSMSRENSASRGRLSGLAGRPRTIAERNGKESSQGNHYGRGEAVGDSRVASNGPDNREETRSDEYKYLLPGESLLNDHWMDQYEASIGAPETFRPPGSAEAQRRSHAGRSSETHTIDWESETASLVPTRSARHGEDRGVGHDDASNGPVHGDDWSLHRRMNPSHVSINSGSRTTGREQWLVINSAAPGTVLPQDSNCIRRNPTNETRFSHQKGSGGTIASTFCSDFSRVANRPIFSFVVLGAAASAAVTAGMSTFGVGIVTDLELLDTERAAAATFGGVICLAGVLGTPAGGALIDFADPEGRLSNQRKLQVVMQQAFWLIILSTALLLIATSQLRLVPFIILFFIGISLLFACTSHINLAVMLACPDELRPLSLAISSVTLHALGDVPSPVLIGALKDALAPHCAASPVTVSAPWSLNIREAHGFPDDGGGWITGVSDACRDERKGLQVTLIVITTWLIWTCIYFGCAKILQQSAIDLDRLPLLWGDVPGVLSKGICCQFRDGRFWRGVGRAYGDNRHSTEAWRGSTSSRDYRTSNMEGPALEQPLLGPSTEGTSAQDLHLQPSLSIDDS